MATRTAATTPAARLTPKQKAFVREYLVDLNATQAAVRAGYSEKTARVIGAENLTKPAVAAALERAMTKRAERTEVTADRVLAELAKLAFANLADYVRIQPDVDPVIDLSTATRDQLAALTEITTEHTSFGPRVRIKMADKRAALELLGRHLALFVDRHEHKHSGNIDLDSLTNEQLARIAAGED